MRQLGWVLAALAFALHCNNKKTSDAIGAASTAPATTVTVAPVASKAAGPPTDYTSFAAAKADGDKAIGKTIFASVNRGRLMPDRVELFACSNEGTTLHPTYAIEKRPLVRAITVIGTPNARLNCRNVVLKVTSRERGDDRFELLEVLDTRPADPTPMPPPGVDYTSADDALVADTLAGKVVQVPARRHGPAGVKTFQMEPCGTFAVAWDVEYRPSQKALVDAMPTQLGQCQTMRVKMKAPENRADGIWLAELINAGSI